MPLRRALGAFVAEETDGQETGTKASDASVDPVAVALALGGASREKADAFLDDQRLLMADQRHHLREQFKILDLTIWEKRTGVLLRAATMVVGLAVAGFFALMIWGAAHSTGLIIEPFAVPSDMAAKGLTGQVVASKMQDKLASMQDATDSARPTQSYENNWGDNIKVEIPDTGISIGELQNFLKGWLGHDTHITGEVWRTETGIAVTAREGAEAGATFTGPETDLDGLMQNAAEHVYSITQPYRYANFLDRAYDAPDIADRAARATAIYRKLIAGPSAVERAWAWNGLAVVDANVKGDFQTTDRDFQQSTAALPDFTEGYYGLSVYERFLGRYENALTAARRARRLFERGNVSDFNPKQLSATRTDNDTSIAFLTGDYGELLRINKIGAEASDYSNTLPRSLYLTNVFWALANLHDGGGLRGTMRDMGISSLPKGLSGLRYAAAASVFVAGSLEDWPAVWRFERTSPESVKQGDYRNFPITLASVALAHAHLGDFGGAEALIARCPTDSDDCLIARGQIADLEGQHSRADAWFARVEQRQPSIPFADAAWGKALLARGMPDEAIAKFQLANRKGPHFADPLEMWGEALMAKNRSDLALARFAEAEKYAPNWGHLHLKWAEALGYAGYKDETRAQYQAASTLDLSAADRNELARQWHG
jgi:tetratricopeptide (TPR) repeat protein